LLTVFNRMKVDRRAVAAALTFGLKAPYMLIPVGFGFIFQEIIVKEMNANGMAIHLSQIPYAMALPVFGMLLGLIFAILVTYRKDRVYEEIPKQFTDDATVTAGENEKWEWKHYVTLLSLLVTLILQIKYQSLVLAALGGILTMFILRAELWENGDTVIEDGVRMMGTIAFVMLIASGYSSVLTKTGAVTELVEEASALIGDNRLLAAVMMMTIGLIVTLGIGTSFGTIPILAAIFVPLS